MKEDRLKHLPSSKIIAHRFSEGKYCDYPADIVCRAVNKYDFNYNPTTIPIELSFFQILSANFSAFKFLYDNYTEENIEDFLSSPEEFFNKHNVEVSVPFDKESPKIIVALIERDIRPFLESEDGYREILRYDDREKSDKNWFYRHKERYPEWYLSENHCIHSLDKVPYFFSTELVKQYGFPASFVYTIEHIAHYLSEKTRK
ncbi:MAG: hypothetical protein J1E16_00370 [Muribaculaceae bacterium]|nr:hypothetical protein [Muribaculaceae bacterium]